MCEDAAVASMFGDLGGLLRKLSPRGGRIAGVKSTMNSLEDTERMAESVEPFDRSNNVDVDGGVRLVDWRRVEMRVASGRERAGPI